MHLSDFSYRAPNMQSVPGAVMSFCMLVLSFSFSSQVHAQSDLEVNEIEVIKHFDARLVEAQKVAIFPRLPGADTIHRAFTYEISIVNPEITYPAPQIRPLALRPEEQPNSYRGSLRLGYGVPNAVLGEASYLLLNKDPVQLMVSGYHNSANHKKVYNQRFSSSGGSLGGNYHASPLLSVSADIGYHHDKVYFYGLMEDDDTPYVDELRTLKMLNTYVGIANAEELAGNINYRASLSYYNIQDDLSAKENGLTLNGYGEKWIAVPSHNSGHGHKVSAEIIADISSLTDSEQSRSLDNFSLIPSYAFQSRVFTAKVGVNLAAHEGEMTAFPNLDIAYKISGNTLIAFAEIDGGLLKNTFYNLIHVNPFIHQRIDEIANTEHRDYSAGIRGNMGKFGYRGQIGFITAKRIALFEPDRFDYRKFQPVYDDGNVIKIEGMLTAQPISHMQVSATIAKMFYDLDTEEKAWHLPGFQAALRSTYVSSDKKLRVHGGITIENAVPYVDEFGGMGKLKGQFDLSVGADYYIIENIGAFVQINNLLGNKHERWYRYETFGMNGVAGILMRI